MIIFKLEKLNGLIPRMLELVSRSSPWHRRLWRAGTFELIEEVLTEAQILGVNKQALSELIQHMTTAIGADPAVINKPNIINTLNKIEPTGAVESYAIHLAKLHVHLAKESYLGKWAEIFRSTSEAGKLDIEGTAKRIVSHLLYCDLPAATIYSIISKNAASSNPIPFETVLHELDQKTKARDLLFHFAVPVDQSPSFLFEKPRPEGWLTPKELKQWKHLNAPSARPIRQQGGFILKVAAKDINGAVAKAQQIIPQLTFKFQIGSQNGFSVLPIMWSQEKGMDYPSRRSSQPLKLRAFLRSATISDLQPSDNVRNLLAIIEPLQTHDGHVAVVNGWVAIESLLVDSNEDDRQGAIRMANIITASYFRTELTWLAVNYSKRYKDTSAGKSVTQALNSMERAVIMKQLILQDSDFDRMTLADQLAILKMKQALTNPKRTFDRTRELLQKELLRLYRKRNLVVHSGRATEHGLEALAQNIVPLLITGIDQLLIAQLQYGIEPKTLAASVEFKSTQLKDENMSKGLELLDLLEAPFEP